MDDGWREENVMRERVFGQGFGRSGSWLRSSGRGFITSLMHIVM